MIDKLHSVLAGYLNTHEVEPQKAIPPALTLRLLHCPWQQSVGSLAHEV